jgi:hypothetical protein
MDLGSVPLCDRDTATARRRLRPARAIASFAQTICHEPPAGMSCPGDRLVWSNVTSVARSPASSYASRMRSVKDASRRAVGNRVGPRGRPRHGCELAALTRTRTGARPTGSLV